MDSKIEQAQVPIGYTTAAALTTTPVWLADVTNWLSFGAVIIGIIVGLTTIYLNVLRSKKLQKELNE